MRSLARLGPDTIRLCVWLALLLAVFALLERRWALRKQKVFRAAFGEDLIYYFLNGLIPRLALVFPLSAAAALFHRLTPEPYYEWLEMWPDGLRLAAALVVGEIGAYWGHRLSHEIPWLWRFHAIHHSASDLDWLVNSRAHPVDLLFTRLCGLIPMFALGLAQPAAASTDVVPMLASVIGVFWGFFIHSNVKWRFGFLEAVVTSPAFHHWHHANDGPRYINKNYAALMPWVDRLFGTYYLPAKEWPSTYGADTQIAPGIVGQLLEPFGITPSAASAAPPVKARIDRPRPVT